VCRQVAPDGTEHLSEFLPIQPVAFVAETAEPLRAVGLTDDGAGADDLSALAPGVARGAQLLQATVCPWQVLPFGQGALPGRFSGAINVEDEPIHLTAIHQLAYLPVFV